MADKQLAREGEVERLRERIRALEEAGRGICEVFLTRVRFTPDGSKSDEEVLAAGRRAVEAFGGQTIAAALREKRIAAAGLDVFEGEPKVHPDLLTVPNVVLTPHIASATIPTRMAMANLAADNLIAFFSGKKPLTPLNPAVLAVSGQ